MVHPETTPAGVMTGNSRRNNRAMMKETYRVAENLLSVSAPEGVHAWEEIRGRFSPFADEAKGEEEPVLEAAIKVEPLPQCDAEKIYEPEYAGIGLITARASRLPDRSLVIEFLHVDDGEPRIRMRMSPALDKAYITIGCDGDENDTYFLAHAMMTAFMLASARTGTLLIHASSVICDGKAYLFQGKSGTGKSTHASLWLKNIPGTELLNDDNPMIRFTDDGTAMAYGSPWSGKTHCYRNVAAPIGALVRIVRDKENSLHRLAPLHAYASLTASVSFAPFVGEELMEKRHKAIERLAQAVACCEMHCRPDDEAARVCHKSLN